MAYISTIFFIIGMLIMAPVSIAGAPYGKKSAIVIFVNGKKYSSFEEYRKARREELKKENEEKKSASEKEKQPPLEEPSSGPEKPQTEASSKNSANEKGTAETADEIKATTEKLIKALSKDPEKLKKILELLKETGDEKRPANPEKP